jgi:ammonia channel protein AmtB
MIMGTFTVTLCFCMMNAVGLNQFDLFTEQTRYNASFGFINPILAGSTSGILNYFLKKKVFTSHVANHLYDIRSLCNGFLAGVAGVAVGSGGMQPIMAIISGVISAAFYLAGCAIFRQF